MNRKQFLRLVAAAAGSRALGAATNPGTPASSGTGSPAALADGRATTASQGHEPKNWTWVRGDFSSMDPWNPRFARWKAAGIDAALPNSGDPETLARFAAAAREEGLESHAWIFTLMRGGMEAEHPEWYAVNRLGDSTAEAPPYVDYYKFLCPNRPPVQEHIAAHVRALTEVDGIRSVHLDYVRFPDVILPVALWETYDLVQDRELPRFDYCYCEVCRELFRERAGIDPLELEDPPAHEPWVRFRQDSVTRLVNRLADVAHEGGKEITAAVFPTPTIARALVRQDWPRWNLDAVLPMIYHSFYEEPVAWIEEAAREGVAALSGRPPLYAGLYVPELSPEQLAEAVRRAMAGGADGVSLFESQAPTDAHWVRLAATIRDHQREAAPL